MRALRYGEARCAIAALGLGALSCALSCTLPAAMPCERDDECPGEGRCDLEYNVCVPRPDGGARDASATDSGQDDIPRSDTGPAPDLEPAVDVAAPPCQGAPPLPASCFSDLFDDGELDPGWNPHSDPTCTVSEEAGATLQFSTSGGVAAACSLATVATYDLRSDAVYLRVPPIIEHTPGLRFFFKVEPSTDQKLEMLFADDFIHFVVDLGAGPITIDPVGYTDDTYYWRIRDEDGSHLYFERAGAGGDYTLLYDLGHSLDLAHVQIGFGLSVSETVSGDFSVSVEGYNDSP